MNKLLSLDEIFHNKLIRVPDYQRGYAWEIDPQVSDFWDDIINLVPGRSHYTGMISLKYLPADATKNWKEENWLLSHGQTQACHVVDGQQRITTFVVLLNSILTLVRGLPENRGKDLRDIPFADKSLSSILEEYIVVENISNRTEKAYRFGYEVDNPSFAFLRSKVFGEPAMGEIKESFYTRNLAKAKAYLDDKVKQTYAERGIAGLEEIFERITSKLLFVLQEIDDDFDVFVAFETMNNRGKSLSKLELLKNRLIYLSTLYQAEELPPDSAALLRERINDAWKTVYEQLGKNEAHLLDDDEYLKNHWVLYYKYSRETGSDYTNFLLKEKFTYKNVTGKGKGHITPEELTNYVQDLGATSVFWFFSFYPKASVPTADPVSDEERLWLEKLNRVGMAYFRDVIVAAYMNDEDGSEARLELLKAIERYCFIVFKLNDHSSQTGQSNYSRKAKELKAKEITIYDVTTEIAKEADSAAKEALARFAALMDDKFKSNNGFYGWDGIKYFLYEYEASLQEAKGSPKISPETFFAASGKKDPQFSVEHIFPQTYERVWYWANQFRFFSAQENYYLANSLGNLLPLSKPINSELQNYPFSEKIRPGKLGRRGYSEGSYSEIEVATRYGSGDWNFSTIRERGLGLLSFLERRWDVALGSDAEKAELLHLGFLDGKDLGTPELAAFEDKYTKAPRKPKFKRHEFMAAFAEFIKQTGRADIPVHAGLKKFTYYLGSDDALKLSYSLDLLGGEAYLAVFFPKEKVHSQMKQDKETIAEKTGLELLWDNDRNNERVGYRWCLVDSKVAVADRDQWKTLFAWAVESYDKIKNSFHEYADTIDQKEPPAESVRYPVEDFLDTQPQEFRQLFYKVRDEIMRLDGVTFYATKNRVAFCGRHMFAECHPQRDCLKIYTRNPGFPTNLGGVNENVDWSCNFEIRLKGDSDIPEAMRVIQASFGIAG
jgi:predicted transport protein